ncbi:MAG: hypothetical protein Q8L57_03530 [bacterium]|nr:hypothetical protein [bacterium]
MKVPKNMSILNKKIGWRAVILISVAVGFLIMLLEILLFASAKF